MLALLRPIWLLAAVVLAGQSERPLEAGMVIERSMTIRPGTYRLSSADLTRPALTIRGDNITVDFNGAILSGGPETADPDVYTGAGVLIEGGRNITVKNAVIRGYKIGILARRSPDLHLSSNDLSYNWKPRLYSGVEKESLVDWMSYHQNEKDEFSNTFDGVGTRLAGDSDVDLDAVPEVHIISDEERLSKLPGGIDPMIKDEATRGRSRIIVDEWGPYDWKHPKLWPVGRPDERPLRLRVLGPPGTWTLHALSGASTSSKSGVVPGELTLTLNDTPYTDVAVTLDYRGADTMSPRGVRVAAGDVYRFSYSRFFVPIDWMVKFFAFEERSHPVKEPTAFSALVSGAPLRTVSSNRLHYISGRAVEESVPSDRFALVAEGAANLPPGQVQSAGYLR